MNRTISCLSLVLLLFHQLELLEISNKGSGARDTKISSAASPIKLKPNNVKVNSGRKGSTGGYGIGGASNAYSRNSYGSSNNKVALSRILAAIAGGNAGYKSGKVPGRHDVPYYRRYGGRNYYYGYNNYEHLSADNRRVCHFTVDEGTPEWNVVDLETNSTVDELVFDCTPSQFCCDVDCCNEYEWWHILLLLSTVAVLCGIFVCCALKFCRKQVDEQMNEYTDSVYTTEKQMTPMSVRSNTNQNIYFPDEHPIYQKKVSQQSAKVTQSNHGRISTSSNYSQAGSLQPHYQPVPSNSSPHA